MAEPLDQSAQRHVVGAEVVAPFADAVRLFDHEEGRRRLLEPLYDLFIVELLGR